MVKFLLVLLFLPLVSFGWIQCERNDGTSWICWEVPEPDDPGSTHPETAPQVCNVCTNTVSMSPDECVQVRDRMLEYIDQFFTDLNAVDESMSNAVTSAEHMILAWDGFDPGVTSDFTYDTSKSFPTNDLIVLLQYYADVTVYPSPRNAVVFKSWRQLNGLQQSFCPPPELHIGNNGALRNTVFFFPINLELLVSYNSAVRTSFVLAENFKGEVSQLLAFMNLANRRLDTLKEHARESRAVPLSMDCSLCASGFASSGGSSSGSSSQCPDCVKSLIEFLRGELTGFKQTVTEINTSVLSLSRKYQTLQPHEDWQTAYFQSDPEVDNTLRRMEYLLYGLAFEGQASTNSFDDANNVYSDAETKLKDYQKQTSITNSINNYFDSYRSFVDRSSSGFSQFFSSLCNLYSASDHSSITVGVHHDFEIGGASFSVDPIVLPDDSEGLEKFTTLCRAVCRCLYVATGLFLLWRFFVFYSTLIVKLVKFVLDFYSQFFGG